MSRSLYKFPYAFEWRIHEAEEVIFILPHKVLRELSTLMCHMSQEVTILPSHALKGGYISEFALPHLKDVESRFLMTLSDGDR